MYPTLPNVSVNSYLLFSVQSTTANSLCSDDFELQTHSEVGILEKKIQKVVGLKLLRVCVERLWLHRESVTLLIDLIEFRMICDSQRD